MSCVKTLHAELLESGLVEVVQQYEKSDDMRLADAAKGVLLTLKKLKDAAAEQAAAANEGDFADVHFDVFLSHKRTEAKDFARGEGVCNCVRNCATVCATVR